MRNVFRLLVSACLVALPALLPSATKASPVLYGANGHYYDFVAGSVTWTDALSDASAQTFSGYQGHLVTITGAGENSFVFSSFDSFTDGFAWIGASDAAVEAEWRWVDGPESGTQFSQGSTPTAPYNYANWGTVEPNNAGAGEDHAGINLGPLTGPGTAPGEWGDGPVNAGNVTGYIIEYSRPAIPEPSTALLLGLGMLGAGLIRRKRRS